MNSEKDGHEQNFISLNVSGVKYELETNILRSFPDSLLGTVAFEGYKNLLKESKDLSIRNDNSIFVQRSPQMFELIVLQTYVTGKLHVPKWMCAENVLEELKFWRLDLENACKCCAEEVQEDDDDDETVVSSNDLMEIEEHTSRWEKFRRRAWDFLDKPSSSVSATIVNILSLAFILLACAILVAESMPSRNSCPSGNDSIADLLRNDTSLQITFPVFVNETNGTFFSANYSFQLQLSNVSNENSINDDDTAETYSDIHGLFSRCTITRILQILEMTSVAWFTVELVSRFIMCPNWLVFFKKPLTIIDILSTIPYYFEITLAYLEFEQPTLSRANDIFLFIRILRCVRVFRILKLARYFEELRILGRTLKSAKDELCMLILFVLIAIFIFSTIMYQLEKDEPDTAYTSIPASCWWGIVTLTTVGYGDMFPKTIGGKCLAAVACVTGIIITAFPVSILVEHFTLAYKNKSQPMFLVRHLKSNVQKQNNTVTESKIEKPEKVSSRKHGFLHFSF